MRNRNKNTGDDRHSGVKEKPSRKPITKKKKKKSRHETQQRKKKHPTSKADHQKEQPRRWWKSQAEYSGSRLRRLGSHISARAGRRRCRQQILRTRRKGCSPTCAL